MGAGAAVAVNLILGLLDRAATISALISKAQAEKRDVTQAELDALVAADKTAANDLDAAIARAIARGAK